MSLRPEFLPVSPEFDPFLFALIGDDENGASLSVLSALTRLGLDPWHEGALLANLSRAAAARSLEPLLARLPPGNWQHAEIPAIASRLVQLLPVRGERVSRIPGPARETRSSVAVWLIRAMCLALGAAALLGVLLPGAEIGEAPRSHIDSTLP
jgi:hypothetical protein